MNERDIVRAIERAEARAWEEGDVLAQAARDAVIAERGAE